MKTIEILNIFFSNVYENDVHEKLLDDIDFVVPVESIKNFVLKLIDIPYSDFLDYINNHPKLDQITSSDITQCSSLAACTNEMCIALMEDENRGKSFVEIGSSEVFKKYITSTQVGALRKYGENQVKTARQFGLAFERYKLWYLSCFGYVYNSLTQQQQRAFLSRTLLRNVLYADILTNVQYQEVHLQQYMTELSASTLGRRTKNVVNLLGFCLESMDKEYISRYSIFYPQYNNSTKKIVENIIVGTKKNYDNLPLYEDYVLGYIPLYSIKAACGYFDRHEIPRQEGWLDISNCGMKCRTEENFVVYAKGNSMAPKIKDGDLCLFRWNQGSVNNGDIVLTQCRDYDSDYESKYTIKLFNSKFLPECEHKIVTLEPINKIAYHPIELTEEDDVEYRIIGVFQDVLSFEDTLDDKLTNKKIFGRETDKTDHVMNFNNDPGLMSSFLDYQNQFSRLTTARREGKKAPHKVILLLSIISLIDKGFIQNNEIKLSDELISEFNLIWNRYVKEPSPFKMNISMPYWHLQNEPFWHLQCLNNAPLENITSIYSKKQLKEKTYAYLDSKLFTLLCKENCRESLQKILIDLLLD